MRLKAATSIVLLALTLTMSARPGVGAQIFESPPPAILDLDPSVRSAAMGGAGSAVFWGVDPDHWVNPALLGLATGIRYEDGFTDFDFGIQLRTSRITAGYAGVGFATAGQPDGLGQSRLDYSGLIVNGVPMPGPSERARSWAVGASVGQLTSTLARGLGREPPTFTRYADVALGYAAKQVEKLVPAATPAGNTTISDGVARDWGLLARATVPLRLGRAASGRLEAAYGFSALSFNAPRGDLTSAEPRWRNGVALHATLDPTHGWTGRLPAGLARGLEPLVSLGGALDAVRFGQGTDSYHYWGAELGIANVAFARIGWNRPALSDYMQRTWGFGLGLPIGVYGGFRFDHAVLSRPDFLGPFHRDSWSVWMDPVATYRTLR